MKNHLGFFLILLLMGKEMSAVQDAAKDRRSARNLGRNMKDNPQLKRSLKDEEPKHNRYLDDMLNFEKIRTVLKDIDGDPIKSDEYGKGASLFNDENLDKKTSERGRGSGENLDKKPFARGRVTIEIKDKKAAKRTEPNRENGGDGSMNTGQSQYDPTILRIHIQEYLSRYVNLIMYLLNLKDLKIPDDGDEQVHVNFDFVISAKDLKILKGLAENNREHDVLDQLYLFDNILSKGINVKEKYSFFKDVMTHFIKSDFSREFWKSKEFYLVIFGMTAIFLIIGKNALNISMKAVFFIMVNNLIVLEGLFTYLAKLKEASIADHVERMQHKSELDVCSREGRSIFGRIRDFFYENECLTYHKSMQMSRADAIFPLESILNAYSFYFVEMPCKILGSGINAFVVSVNDYLPIVVRQLGQATTQYLVMGSVLLMLFLYMLAPEFRFNFWGARLEVRVVRWIRNRRRLQDAPQYRRIRELPLSAIREMEQEYVQQPPEYIQQGSNSVSEDKMDQMVIEENPSEEDNEMEIVDADVETDNESFPTEEKKMPQDVKTAGGLLAE